VTTSSLEALRRFAEAGRADGEGEVGRAIDLLNEAVALDAGFAMAWRRLAVIHGNRGADRAATVQAATRAHEGRERLTERERQLAAAFYHRVVTGDLEEVVRAYRLVLDAHPDDPAALDNLASAYMERERWGEAVDLLERTVAGPSRSRSAYANLVVCLYNVGRIEEAFAALDRWVGVYPPDFAYRRTKAILLLGTGDVDGAQAEVDEGVAALDADLVGRLRLGELGARIAHARGKLDDAERRLREGMAVADAQGLDVDVIWFGMGIARVRTSRGADPVAELGSLDREAERRLERMPALDRPYHEVGLGWAVHARDADRAEAWWRRLIEATTPAVQEEPTFANQALYRRQWLSLLRGRPADALRDLRELRRRRPCARCDLREAALAFEALQQPDSAIASLERWLAGEDFDLVVERAEWRGEVLDVLAGLYEEVGRVADARDAWLRLAEHWADADDALRQRANAAGRRAAELADATEPGSGAGP
jgi:tetratricopeptide (TPR) repeat protein